MSVIKSLFSNGLDVSFSEDADKRLSLDELRKIRLVNYIGLISVINMLLYIIFYCITDFQLFKHAIVFLSAASLVTLMVIYINKAGKHLAAKILLCILTPLYMSYITIVLFGKDPGFQVYLFVAALIPLFLWDYKQKWYPIILITVILIIYVWIEFFPPLIKPRIVLSENLNYFFRLTNLFVCFLAAGTAIGMYQLLYKKKEKQLLLKTEELNLSQAHKDKVYSIIAHDIRSPFATFAGLTEILLKNYHTSSDDERLKIIQSMNQSSMILQNLLENLLDWSRLQSGKLVLSLKQVNLKKIAEESVALNHELIRQKEHIVKVDIDPELMIQADHHMVSTVIRNLVSNAIKFTLKQGRISISASESNNTVKVSIKDTGIGISEKNLKDLFDIRSSSRSSESGSDTLSGLGLLLCKDFVKAHQGEIWVESQIDKGSSFYFTLPKGNST